MTLGAAEYQKKCRGVLPKRTPLHYQFAVNYYCGIYIAERQSRQGVVGLLDKEHRFNIPVILVTHNSDIAEKEIREFGGASETQAQKIEVFWQAVMQAYLTCTSEGTLLRAENSSHYIHLTDSELICQIL